MVGPGQVKDSSLGDENRGADFERVLKLGCLTKTTWLGHSLGSYTPFTEGARKLYMSSHMSSQGYIVFIIPLKQIQMVVAEAHVFEVWTIDDGISNIKSVPLECKLICTYTYS